MSSGFGGYAPSSALVYLPDYGSDYEEPVVRVLSYVDGTDLPQLVERIWKPKVPAITEHRLYEYSESDGHLMSKRLHRQFDDGGWELIEFEAYDDSGRVVEKGASGFSALDHIRLSGTISSQCPLIVFLPEVCVETNDYNQ